MVHACWHVGRLIVEHEQRGRSRAAYGEAVLEDLSRRLTTDFGRGVGFFEAGNFHPDFILWLLASGRQHVIFVDPKGIRNVGATDPKIQFYETIKEIEQRLGNPDVQIHSFIVSNTPSHTMAMLWDMKKSDMASRHVVFQEEDKDTYVRSMLKVAEG